MSRASAALRIAVTERARGRCEYCLATVELQIHGFELDHIQPGSIGGATTFENLAFTCPHCNSEKSDHVTGVDPVTAHEVRLFHPRNDEWHDHFRWSIEDDFVLLGLTAIGRATIERLAINAPKMLRLRKLHALAGFDCTKADFL